jgi:phage portal protein BeeE
MDRKFIMTDGLKAVSLTGEEGWSYLNQLPKTTQLEQYATVAAVFRAFNLKANTVSNMPFTLYKGDEEYDTSATWENLVGFMPNPSELFRLVTLSIIATNAAYNLRTKDALGYKTKGLYHAISYSFTPWVNPMTAQLDYIERNIGAKIERYQPDDPALIRLWRLDHTTEVLPSQNTEARAIASSAGQVFYADHWIKHFYESGGIAPTMIAMKGLVMKDKIEEEEKSWTNWLKQVGKYIGRQAKVYNAEALEVKQLGSSVVDLKNNDVYRQALENIAMGTGIPLSLLLSNSANMATANVEKSTWYSSDIIPFCNWLAYEYNRQVFVPLGLRLEFTPESMDETQEEKLSPKEMIDVIAASPTADICLETFNTLGIEITDGLEAAIEKYFADKTKQPEPPVVPVATPAQPEPIDEPMPEPIPAKWIPSIDELQEMRVWREVALRKLKKADSLDFVYEPHFGGLPANVQTVIIERLPQATSADEVKAVFDIDVPAEPKVDAIKMLADKLDKILAAATHE